MRVSILLTQLCNVQSYKERSPGQKCGYVPGLRKCKQSQCNCEIVFLTREEKKTLRHTNGQMTQVGRNWLESLYSMYIVQQLESKLSPPTPNCWQANFLIYTDRAKAKSFTLKLILDWLMYWEISHPLGQPHIACMRVNLGAIVSGVRVRECRLCVQFHMRMHSGVRVPSAICRCLVGLLFSILNVQGLCRSICILSTRKS